MLTRDEIGILIETLPTTKRMDIIKFAEAVQARLLERIVAALRAEAEELKDEAYCNDELDDEDRTILLGEENGLKRFANRLERGELP